LRVVVAGLIGIHGVARISPGVVDDFGIFSDSVGFPLEIGIAWLVTGLEIVGSVLLIFSYFIPPVCIYFIVQLIMGIFLVHLPDGWFAVGAGRNGIKYSVLLISGFAVIGWLNLQHDKLRIKRLFNKTSTTKNG